MARVIERTEGRYDAQEVEFGTVYRWCPECVMVECECGVELTLTRSATTCGHCGVDHSDVVHEELAARQSKDEVLHPWHYTGEREGAGTLV